ncbi:hypothetical protein [Aliivibrio kagoshimensis]|uniref:hypothetical protein n=1 Tax=Aliivibrio kagoshimensis TaxID=2910230 RepID=UPI003D0B9C75
MNKTLVIPFSMIAFSSLSLACSGDVHMSIPHIHDEDEMINSVSRNQHSELKKIDIHQIFAGKMEAHHHETTVQEEEGDDKPTLRLQPIIPST